MMTYNTIDTTNISDDTLVVWYQELDNLVLNNSLPVDDYNLYIHITTQLKKRGLTRCIQ